MRRAQAEIMKALCLEALHNLYNQRRRSVLALLGIVIGSASISALLTIGLIAEREAMARFKSIGVNSIAITVSTTDGAWVDPSRLYRRIAGDDRIRGAHVAAVGSTTLKGLDASKMVQLAAMTPQDLSIIGPKMTGGRTLGPLDACQPNVLVGAQLARDLHIRSGQTVFLDDYGFSVVGVLGASEPQALGVVSFDQAVITTLTCANRIMPREGVNQILLRLDSETDSARLGQALMRDLAPSPETKMELREARELIASMKAQLSLMGGILLAVGSVSLLVGGIGVMNVMLMAVLERRREIGLRSALGASPREIAWMFLAEAVVLSVGGGVLGALVGVGLVAAASLVLPFEFATRAAIMVTGTGVATGVGLVFGLYPALSAARTQPVEALRAD